MYHTVLVPTDGSSGAEGAVARALDLARTFGASVHALYVVDTRPEPAELPAETRAEVREPSEKRGREATIRVGERAAELDLEVVREVREGVPHRTILDYADEADVDVIVMGTHGRRAPERGRFGSTTERVVALADVPVIAVPLGEAVPEAGYGMYDDVVVATDGSDVAARAADHGLAIAERYGADVHVIYVVDATTYGLEGGPRSLVGLLKEGGHNAVEAIAAEARDRNLPVSTSILRGVPEDAILQYAAGADADLVTMGTRGRSASGDVFLGSTTARVVGRSGIPVLTTT